MFLEKRFLGNSGRYCFVYKLQDKTERGLIKPYSLNIIIAFYSVNE